MTPERAENPPAQRQSRSRAQVALVVVGSTLLGALVGGAVGWADHPRFAASTLLQVNADPLGGDESSSAEAVQSRVQTELLVLDSLDLTQDGTGGAGAAVTATQVASTAVIDLTVTSGSAADAVTAADTAARLYQERRTTDLEARADADAAAAQARLASLADQIQAVDSGQLADVQRQALLAEYTQLVQTAAAAQAAAASAPSPVTVLVPASSPGARQVSSPARDAATGALLGAVLGVGAALLLSRRRSGSLRS